MRLKALDARVKLIAVLSLSTAAVAARSPLLLLALLGYALLLLAAGGAGLGAAVGRARGMLGTLAVLFLIQCLFNRGGAPLLTAGGVTLVTADGVERAALVTLRLLLLLCSGLLLTTGRSRDYLLALVQWHVPYEIAFMVLVALRFLPILREEAGDVLCAVQMRGVRLKGERLDRKGAVYVSILLPVVSGAIRRAEELSLAMEMRAFRACPRRTSLHRLRMKPQDWAALGLFLTVLGVLIWQLW